MHAKSILSPSGAAAAYWQGIADERDQTIRTMKQALLKTESLLSQMVSNQPLEDWWQTAAVSETLSQIKEALA